MTVLDPPAGPFRGADLRGLLRLGVDATVGITGLVEALHHTIASGAGIAGPPPAGSTSGITGFVYRTVQGSTRGIGRGLDLALGLVAGAPDANATDPRREAVVAALNGVWGDHLAATGNPLAITAALRRDGRVLDLTPAGLARQIPRASGRIVVLVHGLCMNDLQWRRQGHDHGEALALDLGVTPVYLHCNSGRHVSENGRDLAALLERLVQAWPVPVQDLALVGHSMGGLIARSACHIAATTGQAWPSRLTRLVFLGTPHHGAPLERGGHRVDQLFGISPYIAPFARLGRSRSAGIADLRYGNLQDADWRGRELGTQRRDDRVPTPLPAGVQAFLVAATTADRVDGLRSRWVGDGLVPLASALGEHRRPALSLAAVPTSHRLVVTGANHWDLLGRAEVHARLREWLA